MKKYLLLFILLLDFVYGGCTAQYPFKYFKSTTGEVTGGTYNQTTGSGLPAQITDEPMNEYNLNFSTSKVWTTGGCHVVWTGDTMCNYSYQNTEWGCSTTDRCSSPDSDFPPIDSTATYPLTWSINDHDSTQKTEECAVVLNGVVESAQSGCVLSYRCKVSAPLEPCDNPQLVRDSNGTCNCPDGSQDFNEQYKTCLSSGACPSTPRTTIYTDGVCYRWFDDCVGFDKATEDRGLTRDECLHPIDPKNDVDGDGIPDALDDDMDGDGIPNNSDPDIDGDGIPNSQDADSGRGPETNSTAPSEDICKLRDPNSYKNGTECACMPTYTMVDGVCKKPESPKDPCNYPSTNSNFDFQGMTLNRSTCVDQYTYWSNNGTGITAKLQTCEKYGCYYNTGDIIGDENASDTSTGTGEDLNNDGFPDMADGNGSTGDENELNKEDAGVLGELIGNALSNVEVNDFLVVNSSGIPPPSTVNIMGQSYTLFDANKIPPSIWETVQILFKFMAIISGVITVFMSI